MRIELLNQDHVKIILSAEELAESGLSYRTLDERDPRARELLFTLIHKAGALLNRDLSTGSVRVEAYPYADGGCILFLSHTAAKQPQSGGLAAPVACCLPSVRPLIALCAELEPRFSHMLLQSAVYLLGRHCVLLLYPCVRPEAALFSLLEQKGVLLAESSVISPLLHEYGTPLIEEDAIEQLSALSYIDASS